MAMRFDSRWCAANIADSHTLPSLHSASLTSTNTRRFDPCSRAARASADAAGSAAPPVLRPARYRETRSVGMVVFDDELTLSTNLAELGKISLRFDYEVLRDGEVLVSGHTRHACVDLASGKPVRMPEELIRLAKGKP